MAVIHDALVQAMGTELQGRRFYERALEHVVSADGRALLQVLIGEENKHLDLLRAQYAALTHARGWLTLEEAAEMAAQVEGMPVFPGEAVADLLIPEGAADDLLLRVALGFERRGANLYREAAAAAASATERALWDYLAGAEERHYEYLQRALDNLVNRGAWSAGPDRPPLFE
jgi:rubrerythrin